MRQRGVHTQPRCTARTEKHTWTQAAELNAAREIEAASIKSAPGNLKGVTGQVPIGAKDATGSLPKIGNDHNLGFIISSAGFDPCLPLTHVVGRSQVCVPITAPDFQSTELVDQKEVDHASNRIGPIHSRGAILQDVDVIDHRKRNQINVHTTAKSDCV